MESGIAVSLLQEMLKLQEIVYSISRLSINYRDETNDTE
jgi:hypothetical protein